MDRYSLKKPSETGLNLQEGKQFPELSSLYQVVSNKNQGTFYFFDKRLCSVQIFTLSDNGSCNNTQAFCLEDDRASPAAGAL